MVIRDSTPEDHAALVELVRAILTEHGFPFEQVGSLEEDLAGAATRYTGRGGFWVAEADGEVVGSVAIRAKDPGSGGAAGTCELKRLYVRADHRGTGLGQALYDHAERFARAAGYRRIWLDSSRRFDRAHRLYERNGFVLVEEVDNEWEDAVFEKALDA